MPEDRTDGTTLFVSGFDAYARRRHPLLRESGGTGGLDGTHADNSGNGVPKGGRFGSSAIPPSAFPQVHGLFSLATAHVADCQSSP